MIGQTIGGLIADGVSGRTTGAPAAGNSDGAAAEPTPGDKIIVTADRVHTPNPITDGIDFSEMDAEWAGLAGFGARITDPAAAAYAAARKAEIVQQLYESDVSRAAGGAPAAMPSRDDIAGTKPPIPVDVRVSLELPQIDSWAQGLDAFWTKNSQTYSVESYNADKAQIAGWRSYVAGLDAQAEAQVNREIGGFILAGVTGGATGALLAPILGGGLLGSSVTAGFNSANAGVPLRWSTGQENSVATYSTDWLLGAGGNVAFRGAAIGLNRLAGNGWVSDIGIGTHVTRAFGEDSGLYGRSWTTDPYSILSRNSLGLETTNSAEFYAHGVVIDNAGITTRAATPWGRFAGGGQETLIPNSARQVRLLGVTMPDHRMPWSLPSDPKPLP